MHYQVRGEGETLLLLHGFFGCGADWERIFPEPPPGYRLIIPDRRGHGRSTNPSGTFTMRRSGLDILGLLDHLTLDRVKVIGLSVGAKSMLHVSTMQPERIEAQVLVSGTPRFPEQARVIMRQVKVEGNSEEEWEAMRRCHKLGDEQIRMLWRQAYAFKDKYDDMNFTPDDLSRVTARTLIVYGDRDPFYPVELGVELYRSIPGSSLWVVPNSGHGPIFGERAAQFVKTALAFLGGEQR